MKRALLAPQIVAGLAIALGVSTILGRFHCDCELEWMTGSVFDHVERIRAGKPIYTAPSVDWMPFLYPPLYYEVVAKVTSFVPLPYGARLVSIAATVIQGVCVWRLARRHGASRGWAFVGLGFFTGAFAMTSFWYDVERVDSLFVAMMAVAVVLLAESTSVALAAVAGLLVGAGFFAKQPGLVFAIGLSVTLLLMKQWRRGAAFACAAAAVIAFGWLRLQSTTDGWFAYYVIHMPNQHGVVPSLFKQLLLDDAPRAFALVAGAACLIGRREGIFAGALAAAAVASGSSRVHLGGWENVLMSFTTFGSAAAAVLGTKLEERFAASRGRLLVPLAAALQMIIWAYNPARNIPSANVAASSRAIEAKVKELEADGEVLVLGRGHLTTPRHAHHAALVDYFRAEHGIPDAIVTPFRERRFAVVVVDRFDDLFLEFLPELKARFFDIVAANYFIAEQLPATLADAPVGYHTHPRLVLRRRKEPLPEASGEAIRCRAKTERALAESRERASRGGAEVAPADLEVAARDACNAAHFTDAPAVPDDAYWQ